MDGPLGQFLRSRIGGSKGRFSIEDHIVHSYAVEKMSFRSKISDRAIRSAHPVEKLDFFNGMRGSDCSIKKVLEAHRISHHPTKHAITSHSNLQQLRCWLDCYCCCCCSQRVSVAHPVLRPPAARTAIRWRQCVLSMTFLNHRCCCCARFGDFQQVPMPQPRR